MLYVFIVFCNEITPMLLLFFSISVIIEEEMPMFWANSDLFFTVLLFSR